MKTYSTMANQIFTGYMLVRLESIEYRVMHHNLIVYIKYYSQNKTDTSQVNKPSTM